MLAGSCPDSLPEVLRRLEGAARGSGGRLADDLALLLLRADAA